MIIKSYESMLVGSNEQLQQDIDLWIGQYENDKTNEPTKTILKTVLYVASYLLNHRAILLPEVSRVFISSYTKSDNITVAISEKT